MGARIRSVKNKRILTATAVCHTCDHTGVLALARSVDVYCVVGVPFTCAPLHATVRVCVTTWLCAFNSYVHPVHKKHQSASGTAINQWRLPKSNGNDACLQITCRIVDIAMAASSIAMRHEVKRSEHVLDMTTRLERPRLMWPRVPYWHQQGRAHLRLLQQRAPRASATPPRGLRR